MSMGKGTLRRRIGIIMMSTVVTFAGVGLLTPQAANASVAPVKTATGSLLASRSDCGSGNFCAWDNYNFSGGPGQWSGNASNWTSWVHTGCGVRSLWTWDNCASSVFNNGNNCNLTFYDDINYSGAYYNLPRGSYLAHMDQDRMSDGGSANDRISSHHWCTF